MAWILFLAKCNSAHVLLACLHAVPILNSILCHSAVVPFKSIHEMGLVHAPQPSSFASVLCPWRWGSGFPLRVCWQTNGERCPLFVAICSAWRGIDTPPNRKGGFCGRKRGLVTSPGAAAAALLHWLPEIEFLATTWIYLHSRHTSILRLPQECYSE